MVRKTTSGSRSAGNAPGNGPGCSVGISIPLLLLPLAPTLILIAAASVDGEKLLSSRRAELPSFLLTALYSFSKRAQLSDNNGS